MRPPTLSAFRKSSPKTSSEDGVTVVEVIVVVALLSVVLGFVLREFVSLQNASTGASLRLQNLDEGRVLMDATSKDLRTAARLSATTSPFDVGATSLGLPSVPGTYGFGNAPPYAGASEAWFFANLTLTSGNPNPCPDVIHLFVDSSANPPVLKEQTIAADAGGTPPGCTYTGSYSTRLVGKYVANSASQPVFTYYYNDATGNPTAYTSSQLPLTASNRLLVNAVGITLAVRQSTNYNVPYTTLQNRVWLPNVDYNPIPSPSP